MTEYNEEIKIPRPHAFISYAWASAEYSERVERLVERLEDDGVEVTYDRKDLQAGDDAYAFMERIVTDPSVNKVMILCDPVYKWKADSRQGGAGTEAQILTPQLYQQGTSADRERKFVAVIMERLEDGKASVPAFYGGRIHIDLSDADRFEERYDELLHFLYDKPLRAARPLGKPPAHIVSPEVPTLGTASVKARVVRAIERGDPSAIGASVDFFETFAENLERFRLQEDEKPTSQLYSDWGKLIVDKLGQLKPYRDEAVDVISKLSKYIDADRSYEAMHDFLENLLPLYFPPRSQSHYSEFDTEHLALFGEEIFVYTVAELLRQRRFSGLAYLLNEPYHFYDRLNGEKLRSFVGFQKGSRALEHYYKSLGQSWISPQGAFLDSRADIKSIPFEALIGADLVLTLRTADEFYSGWWPSTLGHAERQVRSGAISVFARAESASYFDKLKIILKIEGVDELRVRVAKMQQQPSRSSHYIPILVGINKIATID